MAPFVTMRIGGKKTFFLIYWLSFGWNPPESP
jgi:hypothetical protein